MSNERADFQGIAGLGIGTAMVLDETVYLVAMEATFIDPEKTGAFYRTPVSLWGAIILVSIGAGLLLFLYRLASRSARNSRHDI